MPDPKQNQPTMQNVLNAVQKMKERMDFLEKDIKRVKDVLNSQDNWHSETREWLGKEVLVRTRGGISETGTFKWSDRYNICIVSKGETTIWPKGGIDRLGLIKR